MEHSFDGVIKEHTAIALPLPVEEASTGLKELVLKEVNNTSGVDNSLLSRRPGGAIVCCNGSKEKEGIRAMTMAAWVEDAQKRQDQ